VAHLAPISLHGDLSGGIVAFTPDLDESAERLREHLTILGVMIGARVRTATQIASERHHLDQLIRLQNLTARIIRHDNLETDGEDILSEIADVFDYAGVGLGLLRGADLLIYKTYRDAATGARPVASMPASAGVAGRVLRTGAPQFIVDPAHDPDHVSLGLDIRQEICVPVRVNGGVAGILEAYVDERRTLVVDDLGILLMLAESIGLVLANHRRLAEVERRNHQLRLVDSLVTMIAERTMIQRAVPEIVREIADRFSFQLVSVGLVDDDRLKFTIASQDASLETTRQSIETLSLERGVSGRVVRTGTTAFIEDVRTDPDYVDVGWGSRSEICVPIHADGSIIGVLNVESGENRPLDESDLEVLQIIARHLGIAFETEALLVSERNTRRALEALQRVSTIVTSSLTLDEALRRIVETLGRFFDYPYVVVGLCEDQFVIPSAAHGIAIERLVPMPLGSPPAGLVAQTGQRLYVPDTAMRDDLQLGSFPDATSMLVVPIRQDGAVLGVLTIIGTDARPVEEQDIALLDAFAGHAGIVLKNAEMYEEARRLALIDPMTQLPNHRQFQERFTEELDRARAEEGDLAVLVIDLDGFKEVNDRFGHLEGDAVLTEVGRRLARHLREFDLLARYAGDEFVILLPGVNTETGVEVAHRLCMAMNSAPFQTSTGEQTRLTISVGVSSYPEHGATKRDLLASADAATYDAKRTGRDTVKVGIRE
jgi:diguanylate cyclase (GGDEF)-like protein